MFVKFRPEHFFRWCILCTSLTLFTTIINLYFIFRGNSSRSVSVDSAKVQLISPSIFSNDSSIDHVDRYESEASERFKETFQLLVQAFVEKVPTDGEKPLHYCPAVPPNLRGPSPIENLPKDFSLLSPSQYHPWVEHGGSSRPSSCLSRHKVAIIVPYRDRWEILRHFLFHMHQILQRQQLDYRIFVCEQAFDKTFNKGIVMNGCFKEILRLQPDRQCFVMHDVDLLLIDDRNMYSCPIFPRHMSVAIDKFRFYLPYKELVGGVLAMHRDHYLLVNGYSTNYWGWGGEDDDMHARIVKKKLILQRPPTSIARYKMLKHTHQKLNPVRMKILRTAQIRVDSDGVNNVKYGLLNTTFYHLYTHFLIDVGQQPS